MLRPHQIKSNVLKLEGVELVDHGFQWLGQCLKVSSCLSLSSSCLPLVFVHLFYMNGRDLVHQLLNTCTHGGQQRMEIEEGSVQLGGYL